MHCSNKVLARWFWFMAYMAVATTPTSDVMVADDGSFSLIAVLVIFIIQQKGESVTSISLLWRLISKRSIPHYILHYQQRVKQDSNSCISYDESHDGGPCHCTFYYDYDGIARHGCDTLMAVANILLVLPVSNSLKIFHRREVHDHWPTNIKSSREVPDNICSMLLLSKLNVYITCHVVGEVVANIEGFDFVVPGELRKDILIELLEVVLDLAAVDGVVMGVAVGGYHVGALNGQFTMTVPVPNIDGKCSALPPPQGSHVVLLLLFAAV
ncbi:hypothetical protein V8G54_031104 [Vigna mungo]|uniref:Uncharacterized protein n=1 Tax=Vigna mungo TaxID=3915 RepID=A0AAQ3RNK5_VIGMU